jgi:hypothetical protein
MEPVWDTEWDNVMVAVLDTNLVPKMGNFLPPSSQCRIVGSKNGALMRHCCFGGFLLSKKGDQNATIFRYIPESLPMYGCF